MATTVPEPVPDRPAEDETVVSKEQAIAPSEENTDAEKSIGPTPAGTPDEAAEEPVRKMSKLQWGLVCVAIFTTNFLYGLDNTIVADIQGAVVEQFNEVDKIIWLGSGFALGGIAVILGLGKAFGIFDIKWLWIATTILFEVGSVICGAAHTMDMLVVGRVIAGVGAAGMYLGDLNLIAAFTSVRERPAYIGVVGLIWGLGLILGPVIGGAFADNTHATWRWAFYINLVLIGAMSWVFFFLVPSYQPQPGVPFTRKLLELDWVGIALNAGIYVTWILVLQFAGTTWAWSDGRTIACFVVVGVLIIAFALQQYFTVLTTADRRIFPGEFIKSRTHMLLFVCTNCITAAGLITIFYVPEYFQFVHGDNGVRSSVRLLPFIFFLVFGSLASGFTLPVYGLYIPWYIASGVLITVGSALMFTVTSSTSTSAIYGYTLLIGFGSGICLNTGYSIAQAKVYSTPNLIPAAIALQNVAQLGGVAHALAISSLIFQNVAFDQIKAVFVQAGVTFTDTDIREAIGGAKSTVFLSLTDAVRQQAVDGIVKGMQRVYILNIASGALLLVCALLLRREKLFLKL